MPQDTHQNISEVEQLRNQVSGLKDQLREAQKMTALGELVSTTTHEFNNMLMTILNYAKLGLRHKDEPTRDKALSQILEAGQRAEKITNSVLGMARNRGNEMTPTDLESIMEQTLVLLEREMTKYRVAINRQFATVPKAMANGNQIQQVLLNLLTNARQAMPSGGTIILKLSHDEAAKTIDLMVQDTGEGIPKDKLQQIFNPFFSTKDGPDASGKGGTGVGLSMCHEIIQGHHGKIRVQSEVGRGTAFTLRIPMAEQMPALIKTSASAALGLPVSTQQS